LIWPNDYHINDRQRSTTFKMSSTVEYLQVDELDKLKKQLNRLRQKYDNLQQIQQDAISILQHVKGETYDANFDPRTVKIQSVQSLNLSQLIQLYQKVCGLKLSYSTFSEQERNHGRPFNLLFYRRYLIDCIIKNSCSYCDLVYHELG
jgi:hypothetical protein